MTAKKQSIMQGGLNNRQEPKSGGKQNTSFETTVEESNDIMNQWLEFASTLGFLLCCGFVAYVVLRPIYSIFCWFMDV